jgi:hypothetical protein
MRRLAPMAALFLLAQIAARPALAGIADSPLPTLVAGKTTFHVYSVPGIQSVGPLSTFFSCTSTDTATMQVGVETFNFLGGAPDNDPVATSVSVVPGGTVVFGTTPSATFSISSDLAPGFISKGSARILATSRKLICTAYLADPVNVPPTSMVHLTIVKVTSQQGD